ncbi:penicillin-binding protein 2 [Bacteroidia bacterium]|nr:penicillin-binding protein 2 [Bacteroidia bacterium]
MKNKSFDSEKRKRNIIYFVSVLVLIYIIQLFKLQIMDSDYKQWADSNAFLNKKLDPSRGEMYDRNGKLLVYNQPAYDVMVVMRETESFDTLAFCKAVNITLEDFKKKLSDVKNRKLNPGYSSYTPQPFLNRLGNKEYGVLQESLYKFPGFYIQNRTVREYSYKNAAHVLGYIAEADKQNLSEDNYYVRGDNIGKNGVEKSYEVYLRGTKGAEILLRDAHGSIKGKYEEGIHDRDPIPGKDLTLSIDIDLQAYGEELMQNKLGSIVMIEPATGEILCMVSAPTYDPSTLVGGRQFGANYAGLLKDYHNPLLNRAINGAYPPGSAFKPAQALSFLQENIIQPTTAYTCYGGFPLGVDHRPHCHPHGSPLSLIPALATSCNAYFCWGLKGMFENKKYGSIQNAMDKWRDLMVAQGYGNTLGTDLPSERRGLIPNSQTYDKIYKGRRWNAFSVISISIGQGEVEATPLQICNFAATVANRGYFYTPHIVKKIKDTPLAETYTTRRYTGIDPIHYQAVADGMRAAVTGGTCTKTNIFDIEVCGKTGTSQNIGKDHSIFMGFAPKDNPKVAIFVIVENGGWGANYGVPIGRLMIEKYLKGEVSEYSKMNYEYVMKNAVILKNAIQKK